jgi:endonuclease-3
MSTPSIREIVISLGVCYGRPDFRPNHDPLAELVQTILSQNTSDANSRPAFKELMRTFDSWEKIINAGVNEVAEAIKGGGLGMIKAQRIQKALREIKEKRGKLDLTFLDDLPVPEAREWLKELPGVGNKTANCVLLFALGKPALPVDTHVYRVSKRLGLVREKASLDEAHETLEALVPAEDMYYFHVLMIEHGRRTCIAQRPRCPQCILRAMCPRTGVREIFISKP